MNYFWLGASAEADQALAVPVEPVSRLDPTGFDPSRVEALASDLRSAASREGKPRGDHMIACEEQIVRHFREHWADDDEAQNIADVADCMAHALRAEKAMVDGLTAAAINAASELERIARSHNGPPA